jgi:mRNA export factor
MTVLSGGCDKLVKMWPLLSGGQPTALPGHEALVKEVAWIPQMNLLVSGSWDKTLRYENDLFFKGKQQRRPLLCYFINI